MNHVSLIGQRIELNNEIGTVLYSGPLLHNIKNPKINPNDHWLGIMWDSEKRGNHKGQVENVQYFQCLINTSGSLIKYKQVNFGIQLVRAYINKYFKDEQIKVLIQKNEDELLEFLQEYSQHPQVKKKTIQIEFDEEALIKTSKAYKKIEFLGFDRIWSILENTQKLHYLALDHQKINSLGKNGMIKKLFLNVKELSLTNNLIYDLEILNRINEEFPLLEKLILSLNKFAFNLYEDQSQFQKNFHGKELDSYKPINLTTFENLKILSLTQMNLTFKKIKKFQICFKNIEELILGQNYCNDFEEFPFTSENFPNLKRLDLSQNEITTMSQMKTWQGLKLKNLNLQGNAIQFLEYLDFMEELESINIQENLLESLQNILFFLVKLTMLKKIRYLNNPFLNFHDKDQIRCCFVTCIYNVETINGSKLKYREKQDSEIYYLKNTFHLFFKEFCQDQFNYDFYEYKHWIDQRYPLIEELLIKFDNPYPIAERNYQEVESKQNRYQMDLEDKDIKMSKNFTYLKFLKEEGDNFIIKKKFPLKTKVIVIKKYLKQTLKIKKLKLINLDTGEEMNEDMKSLENYINTVTAKIMLIENQLSQIYKIQNKIFQCLFQKNLIINLEKYNGNRGQNPKNTSMYQKKTSDKKRIKKKQQRYGNS